MELNELSLYNLNYVNMLHPVIKHWNDTIEKRALQELDTRKDEDYYALLYEYYNHLYAGVLLTMYSALEKELSCIQSRFMNTPTCDFECKKSGKHKKISYNHKFFSCCLEQRGITNEDIPSFPIVNVLRLYCNAYKHNAGNYTPELLEGLRNLDGNSLTMTGLKIIKDDKEYRAENLNNLQKNETINYININVVKLYEEVCIYFENLMKLIEEK